MSSLPSVTEYPLGKVLGLVGWKKADVASGIGARFGLVSGSLALELDSPCFVRVENRAALREAVRLFWPYPERMGTR